MLETPLQGPAAERCLKDIKSHLGSCGVTQVSCSLRVLQGVDGEISELTNEQVYPQVVAPVEIPPGEEHLFHFDAGLSASQSSEKDRASTGDYTWSARAAGADLRPNNGLTPASVKELLVAARQRRLDAAGAEPQPAAPALEASEHQGPSEPITASSTWLRSSSGQWQRQVFIQGLVDRPEYNGRVAWVTVADWDRALQAEADPPALSVELDNSTQRLFVRADCLCVVHPQLRPKPLSDALVMIEVWLTPRPGAQPALARLVVDSACTLEGVLSKEFVQRWGWDTLPATTTISTASGEKVAGVPLVLANTRFTPQHTRRVAYGVLDLPGFDGLLGAGFLDKCKTYEIAKHDSHKVLRFTPPRSAEVVEVLGVPIVEVEMHWGTYVDPTLAVPTGEAAATPVLSVQWEPPSASDLQAVVGQFQLTYDPVTRAAILAQAEVGQDGRKLEQGPLQSPDDEDGLVFLAMEAVKGQSESLHHVPPAQRERLAQLLDEFRTSVFRECEFPPFPPERAVEFQIQLQPGAQVPASPVHKLSPALLEQLRAMIKELLHNGLIVPTSSPFAAPLLLVKKPDGGYRICIDYRKLNAVTIKDRYPLPNPSMLFDKLAGCSFFSKLDLRWGYFQVRTAEADVEKTAFRSPFGSFAWKVMGMGLTNAAPTFQRLMDSVFRDLEFVSCYLDDILIASRSAEEHIRHVEIVLQRLRDHQFIAREVKCSFFQTEIKFLGFVFSAAGRAVDPARTMALQQMAPPQTVHELQRWLGMVNYYRSFIPKYAHITAPLTDLLKSHPAASKPKSGARLLWLSEHQHAFEAIRTALASPPLLRIFDPALPSRVEADSSGIALGGVLKQEFESIWHPVAYYSRKLSPAETRYTTRERECLAVKECLAEWRHYLLGAPFKVGSDHQSLQWLSTQNVTTLSDRLLRWVEFFSLFDFVQEYLPGQANVIPDYLSRPAVEVLLITEAGEQESLDLIALAILLHEGQDTLPVASLVCPVLEEWRVETDFYSQLRAAQTADPHLTQIKQQLLAVQQPPPACRMLYAIHNDLVVVPEVDGRQRIVVPPGPLRKEICKLFHDEGGHPGGHRTLAAISRHFFWPKMSQEVRTYAASCDACQAAKGSNRLPGGYAEPHALPAEPGAHWTLDFLELPKSANGYTCLLTMTDRVSKLIVLVPMRNTTALDVAEAFVQNVFCWFGAPLSLCSDRGPPFHSAVMHEIFSMLGSTLKFSTPHTPHSHGEIERQHRIINELQRILYQGQFPTILAKWDEYAKIIQFMLNAAVVERHGMSPLYFFFGRQPRLPASPDHSPEALDPASLEFVLSFQTRLQEALDVGRVAQSHLIEKLDRHRDPHHTLSVGDWAYVDAEIAPIPGNSHFRVKYAGPFLVKAVTTSTATLEIPEHWQLSTNTFNVDKLKKYIAREGAPLPPCPRRFAKRVARDQVAVSRVSHHRRVGRISADGRRKDLQFYVHWQGLPSAYGEWLSEAALRNLPSAVAHIHTYLRDSGIADP